MMLRPFWFVALTPLLCSEMAVAQMMPQPPGGMSMGPRPLVQDDGVIVTLPDRDNPVRLVECGSGSYEQIISDCSEVLALPRLDRAKRAAAFVNRATARYWLRQYPGAAADYDQALALQPGSLQAALGAALAYREMRHYERAIADFDTAIRLKSNWLELYLQRAVAYAEAGDYPKALADLDRVLRSEPNNATARLNRSIVLYRQELAAQQSPLR
jgi:tetratricopeptide (TPR) repeat protein